MNLRKQLRLLTVSLHIIRKITQKHKMLLKLCINFLKKNKKFTFFHVLFVRSVKKNEKYYRLPENIVLWAQVCFNTHLVHLETCIHEFLCTHFIQQQFYCQNSIRDSSHNTRLLSHVFVFLWEKYLWEFFYLEPEVIQMMK